MSSFIFIGIGSTGLNILEEIQQFHFESEGRNRPGKNVEYLYCETDVSNLPKKTASGDTDIVQVPLSLGNNEIVIRDLSGRKDLKVDWLPLPAELLNSESGASAKPTFGRLSLWGGNNYNQFKDVLLQSFQRVQQFDISRNTEIIIVGSFAGGTGSGLCVDLAYLVRHITNVKDVHGIFLLPDALGYSASGNIRYENTFVSLASIDFYTKKENRYEVVWPDGSSYSEDRPPFKHIHYLSSDFSSHRSMASSTFDELRRSAGLLGVMYIYNSNLTDIYTFSNLLNKREIDLSGNEIIRHYRTMGFKYIEYPKSKLEELLAVSKAKHILLALCDEENYRDQNGRSRSLESLKVDINNSVRSQIEKIITGFFNNVLGKDNYKKLEFELCDVLMNSNFKRDNIIENVFNQFSSLNRDNSYFSIQNSSRDLENDFLNEIESYLDSSFDKYENVKALRYTLEAFINSIKELKQFYESSYGITGNPDSWNRRLSVYIEDFAGGTSGMLFNSLKRDFVAFHIEQLSKLCLINSLVASFPNVIAKLNSNEDVVSCSFSKIDYNIVQKIKKSIESEDDTSITLTKRQEQLKGLLTLSQSSFYLVYENGTFNDEYEAINQNYENNSSKLNAKSLLGGSSLWMFFKNFREQNLYQHVVTSSNKFVKNIDYFASRNALDIFHKVLSNSSIYNDRISSLFNYNIEELRRTHLPPMIKCVQGPSGHLFNHSVDNLNLMFISSDINKLNSLMSNVQIDAVINSIELPALTNGIFLYQQYAVMSDNDYFNPLKHVSWMPDFKRSLLNRLDEMNEEELISWRKRKCAYLNIDQLKNYLLK